MDVSIDPSDLIALNAFRQRNQQIELQRQQLEELRRANELERRKALPYAEQKRLAEQDKVRNRIERLKREAEEKKSANTTMGVIIFLILCFIVVIGYGLYAQGVIDAKNREMYESQKRIDEATEKATSEAIKAIMNEK